MRTFVQNKILTGFREAGNRVKTPNTARVTIKQVATLLTSLLPRRRDILFLSIIFFCSEKPLSAQKPLPFFFSAVRAALHGGWTPGKGETAHVGEGEGLQMPPPRAADCNEGKQL